MSDQPQKHPYKPEISFGDYAVIATFVLGTILSGAGVYALLRSDVATAAEQNARQDVAIDKLEDRAEKRMDRVETKITSLESAANDMRVMQSAMAANLEMLVRAEGLRPVTTAR